MNILSYLPWRKVLPARKARRPDAIDELPCTDEERPLGCGWFDSSHDLQCGLMVREHASVDAAAAEVPLAFWLDLKLAGPQPGVRA